MADVSNSTAAAEIHREAIEDEIERLIDILDMIDPDPDLEPSLGLNGYMHLEPLLAVDLEGDCEDEGAQCDDEGYRGGI
jgi:hypothetical protein